MAASAERRSRAGQRWLVGTILLAAVGAAHAEPGPAQPLLGEGAADATELPDFRSDLIDTPRYRNPASPRAVKVGASPTSDSGLSLGYDRRLDEHQLRTPPPIHERMRANMRDPQPATVLKLHLR